MLRKLKSFKGYPLAAKDGEIGHVRDCYFDEQTWEIRYLVVETGGWLTGKSVLISPRSIELIDDDTQAVIVNLTRKQVEDSPTPSFDQPMTREFERDFHDYYAYPYYWTSTTFWGPISSAIVPTPGTPSPEAPGNAPSRVPHEPPADDALAASERIRNSSSVRGYSINAEDGEIGHITDFIVDDRRWELRYLEVDTGKWLPGRHVLIGTHWIEEITWPNANVQGHVTREMIKNAPAYHAGDTIDAAYEDHLEKHYTQNA